MHRAHRMPFGATVRDDGTVDFGLWAPGARRVEVRLEAPGGNPAEPLPMRGTADGWYVLRTDAARAGSLYRFVIDGKTAVPDPASRFQPAGVHGPSEVIDPLAYTWSDGDWRGRPWHEAVLYEIHVGTFTPDGTYAAAAERLDHLAELGITAIELMPVAESPGGRGWGYDGVLPFAPEHAYGRPDDLKRLVDAAHRRGLMVFLDVVYNHFGPEGNYLHLYAPTFFTDRYQTPWGDAIDFESPGSRPVRDYFVHNALYWLHEFHFDGLRLDAVHAIHDASTPDILIELASTVEARYLGRYIHLVLENDDNAARYLERDGNGRPLQYAAQWNDDLHHAAHVLLTGERNGYYEDYADAPMRRFGRALAEGFAYQGEPSRHRDGRERGARSAHLPPAAFVSFLQNHDQIGNRAFGERIGHIARPEALRAAMAALLLAPSPPLLFMGEEWNAPHPFPFFCDLGADLADAVREGRRREFAHFPEFADPEARARIPDPLALETFLSAKLDWSILDRPEHAPWLAFYRRLLQIRHRAIVPRLAEGSRAADWRSHDGRVLELRWTLAGSATLEAVISLANMPVDGIDIAPRGRLIFATAPEVAQIAPINALPAWFCAWFLDEREPPS